MLTVPVAQVALGFGADDIDGTVHKETILHDAGAKSPRALSEDKIVSLIREAGRIPAACDCNYRVLHTFGTIEGLKRHQVADRLESVSKIPY